MTSARRSTGTLPTANKMSPRQTRAPPATGRRLGNRHAFRAVGPQHAVLDLVPLCAQRDVRDAQHEQHRDDRESKQRATPGDQASRPFTRRGQGNGGIQHYLNI